jgi:hypothetical protein
MEERQIALNVALGPREFNVFPKLQQQNCNSGYKAGIVDATQVTRVALQKSASMAALLIMSEAVGCAVPGKVDAGEDRCDTGGMC